MISIKDRDEIIDFLIERLDSFENAIPYREINKNYGVSEVTLIEEVLKELSNNQIFKESGNTFISGRLLAKGLEIKRNGGWLKRLELNRIEEENKRIKERAELEHLISSTKLSKIQIRWFKISLIIGFFGGLSGLISLAVTLNDKSKSESVKPNSALNVDNVILDKDTTSSLAVENDSVSVNTNKNVPSE